MKYRVYKEETLGRDYVDIAIPDDMVEEARRGREFMLEAVSSHDDRLLEKLVAEQPISEEELKGGDS